MLAKSPGAYHVFVYASMPRKIAYIQERFPEHAKDAEREIVATDRRRAEYIRRFHQREWDDRKLYHLMMNSCMGMNAMVEATIEAAGLRAVAAAAEQADQAAVG
jgi:cytidylate kinase